MKKILYIFFSLFVTLVIFICCDILFFNHIARLEAQRLVSIKKELFNESENQKINLPKYFIKLKPISQYYPEKIFRPVMNANSKENSIIIFGCSYAYGHYFDDNQTISYIMSKYSQRPIYNRSISGWGIQHVIYQLSDENFPKIIKTKPKYIFYILMGYNHHFKRLYYTCFPSITNNEYYFTYKEKKNKLIEKKPLFNMYYNFALFRHIHNKIIDEWINKNWTEKSNEIYFNFFILHFKTINKLIKTLWGEENGDATNPQLIILTFDETQKEYWQHELEKDGIKVIDIIDTIEVDDIYNSEKGYFIDGHPVGKLWELLIPKLKEIYPDL